MKIKKKQVLSFKKATIANLNGIEMSRALGGSDTDHSECLPTYDCATDEKDCHYETGDTLFITCNLF